MRISELCIKRPVFSIVINIVLVLLGVVSYDRLSVREYPNIDVPVITVETHYPGASASIIETQVTKPLEDSLSGIEGIDFIRSISRSELSQITVQFRLSRDQEGAASDVRDRVGRVRGALPEDVDEPIVSKTEADAQPIIWLALSSETQSSLDVSEYADLIVQDRLQTLPGVANVMLFAERRYSMRVWLDSSKLASYKMTVAEVENALRSQNVEIPSGRIESSLREFTVLTETDLNTPEEFQKIILRVTDQGHLVRLGDIARVELGAREERQIARFNNKNTIALGVVKQSIANPLEISQGVRALLPDLQHTMPQGMKLEIAYDSSVFIDESLNSVFHTIIEAILLVVLVIYFFLRTARATLIPLVTIPVSLIGAMALMYWMGFSINTLTLLAMVVAIGLVVDDAIVVLENSYRHIEEGLDPIHAAVKGIREIGFAVVAMTLTLAAVFAPIAFTPGRTGQLFIEFALTLAGAVLVSGFIALTLTPMMCSRMLRNLHGQTPAWSERIENWLLNMERGYKSILTRSINKRITILAIAGAVMLLSVGLFYRMPSELSPAEDRGIVFAIGITPEGSTLEYSDTYAKQMEAILQSAPEAEWNFMAIGFPFITQSFSVLGLKPWDERDRSSLDIIEDVGPRLFGLTGAMVFAVNPPSLGQGATSQPVEFIIQTTGTYQEMDQILGAIMGKLYNNPGFRMPDSDLKLNKPELKLSVNRDKVATSGVKIDEIGRTLETMLGEREVTRFKRKGEQYDVVLQLDSSERNTPQALNDIFVRGSSDTMIQLSNLVNLQESVAPRELNHFNKLRAGTIKANLAPDYSLGEALTFLEKTTREIAPSAQIDYGGVSREFKESSASMSMLFGLAITFIYLVLAAQFESFRDPVIILLTVPLAMAGALGAMTLTGGTLNVYSQIGLVALIGLISKHGILIVEFANQLQEQGHDMVHSVIESASVRLRPILMTTGAMVLGAVPLALSSGAGAESRQAIGWVLVGGMSVGTVMTLFIVPTFYLLISKPRKLVEINESLINAQ